MTIPKQETVRASVIALKNIVLHRQHTHFIWKSDDARCQPLLIDTFTASKMVAVYDACSPHNKRTLSRMVAASRNQFIMVFNIAMSCGSASQNHAGKEPQ